MSLERTGAPKRALRLALILVGLLLLSSVPYGRGVWLEYRRFRDYVDVTLRDPARPPAWRQQRFEPRDCVDAALQWFRSCPGLDDFCSGGLRETVRRCMNSRDRSEYCRSLDRAWASTRFGHHACENVQRRASSAAERKVVEDHCGAAYREVARHCAEADLAGF